MRKARIIIGYPLLPLSHFFIKIPLWLQYCWCSNRHQTYRAAIFQNIKEFNKTRIVRARTAREFRHTKIQNKDIRSDRSRSIGDWRLVQKVSLGRASADTARHRTTTNSKAAVSERTQAFLAKVLEGMTSVQPSEIDFWAMNILDEQNGEARRREMQCPSLLPITLVPIPDQVLDSKRTMIDKILQSEQAQALCNFRIGEGMLAHLCEQQEDNSAIDIPSWMVHNLGGAERTHFARTQNENGTNISYLNLAANQINSHLNSETGSYMLRAQIIARSDTANKDAKGITNLLPRDQPPPGQGLYTQRNAAIPQSTIFPPTLNMEQEIPGIPNVLTKETIKDQMRRWVLKGFDLKPVGKDDEGQCWPGFDPGVPHATDWKKSKQQSQTLSLDDVRAFLREHHFELRVACVRKECDSEDDSETLQQAKTTRQEFRNRF
ncbi:MAG: hypothetical protein EZS28_022263 [Streblomastix strix]|uniref:Uncharacterized protein n=1 Tax=Streblomastix strix TaxID=222440 RepID=A0A5J4VI20_9EUKA|nr:MAG: hypothetical protein EZS28_022263 [Streblomastix strix]